METNVIFNSIQNDICDPVSIADEFINAKFPIDDVKLKFTQLLVYSCGINENLPEILVSSGNINAVLDFIEKKSRNVHDSAVPLNNSKFFKRCTSFFERIFILEWNTFANGGNFDTYFSMLIEGCSIWEPKQLHVVGFAIKLKLVTAFLRGGSVESDPNAMPKVKRYAMEMLKKAVFYKTIQCSILAATELYEWIKFDDSFATDENFRLLTWSIKLDKPRQVCHGLLIAYSLLRMEHLQNKMILFVRKLVSIFEDLCFTENNIIFDWICRCSELIYKYNREAISPNFWNDLLDNLFAKDRQRAKSAVGFWMGTVFDPICHRTNFRLILNFLKDVGPEHWKVLVDSLIDDYPAMVDWKLQIKILLDEDDDVPEEVRLSIIEKEGLLRLMSHAVEESVAGFPPLYRAKNMKALSLAVCHGFSCEVSEALVPVFWKLYNLEYSNKERAQIALISMVKYFNFEIIEPNTMFAFIKECSTIFKTSRQPFCHQVVLDMLRLIVNNARNYEVTTLGDMQFQLLKDHCESEVANLIGDFFSDPNKYANLQNESVRTAETTLIQILSLNRVMIVNRKIAFDIPQQILQNKVLFGNPVFLCLLYVSVCLICEHVVYALKQMMQIYEEEHSVPDNYNDTMNDVDYTIKTLSIKLKEWYPCSELSIGTFCYLCKILETVRELSVCQETWDMILPSDARFLISGYVAHMIWKTDDEWGPVENINDAATKTWIVNAFLNLIKCSVLPLFYAYDIMTSMRLQPEVMEKPLRKFISQLCVIDDEVTLADWMLKWMTCLFLLSSKDCLEVVTDFVKMIYPIRKQMQNIIYLVIRKGIDFAVSKPEEDENSSVPRHEFFNVLVKLCEISDDAIKVTIEKYLTLKTFSKEDIRAVKSFSRRLKKKSAPKKVEKSTPQPKPERTSSSILGSRRTNAAAVDDSLSIWSPSSVTVSNSVLADESDLDSIYSTERPLFMIRSNNESTSSLVNIIRAEGLIDEMADAPPLASSTPMNLLQTLTERTSQTFGEVNKLLEKLQMRSAEDHIMDLSSSASITNENSNNISKDSRLTRSTEPVDEMTSILVEKVGILTGNMSQVLENVNDLLKNQESRTMDKRSMAKSLPVSVACEDVSDISEKTQAVSPMMSAHDLSKDVSPTSSTSIKKFDAQTESASLMYDVSKLLKSIGKNSLDEQATASSSSMTESSKDGDDILRELQIENPNLFNQETSNDAPSKFSTNEMETNTQTKSASRDLQSASAEDHDTTTRSLTSESSEDGVMDTASPSALPIRETPSPTSSTAEKDLDSEVESASQVLENIRELLQGSLKGNDVIARSPAMSESSGDEMKDLLHVSSSASCPEVSMDVSSISCSPENLTNTPSEGASCVYKEVRNPLKSRDKCVLKAYRIARSSSVSGSSKSNVDVLKDSRPEGPSIEAVRDVSRDLFRESIEKEDTNQQSGSSMTSEILTNLQRISLSSAQTETRDSSVEQVGKSPSKKKRRFKR